MKEPLIILTGPTAVGKTHLSIALAKAVGGEIISADSMQVYKHMDIGSAKIMPQEMDGVRHYLVDELEPFEEFHVVRFQEMVSMKGLGYKEILDYLDGITTLPEAVEILKRDTRHFAKRQITWFKREEDVIWLNKQDYAYDEDKILGTMLEILREKDIIK